MANGEPPAPATPAAPRRSSPMSYVRAFVPVLVFGSALCGLVVYGLYQQQSAWARTDEANLREWLNESRSFRKTLPELVRQYLESRLEQESLDGRADPDPAGGLVSEERKQVAVRAEQIADHLAALAEPTRMYQGQLLLFPEV